MEEGEAVDLLNGQTKRVKVSVSKSMAILLTKGAKMMTRTRKIPDTKKY